MRAGRPWSALKPPAELRAVRRRQHLENTQSTSRPSHAVHVASTHLVKLCRTSLVPKLCVGVPLTDRAEDVLIAESLAQLAHTRPSALDADDCAAARQHCLLDLADVLGEPKIVASRPCARPHARALRMPSPLLWHVAAAVGLWSPGEAGRLQRSRRQPANGPRACAGYVRSGRSSRRSRGPPCSSDRKSFMTCVEGLGSGLWRCASPEATCSAEPV